MGYKWEGMGGIPISTHDCGGRKGRILGYPSVRGWRKDKMVGRPYAGDRNSDAACHLGVCESLTAREQDIVVLCWFGSLKFGGIVRG